MSAPRVSCEASVLTPEAKSFLVELAREFRQEVEALLTARERRSLKRDAAWRPDFLPETREIRDANWTVAPIPADLLERKVEITGPVDRKMMINALNSGANVFMADFEDSNSPTWKNQLEGQLNLRDAVLRRISYSSPETGKEYRLNEHVATLMVRPRGWHLPEKHFLVDDKPIPGALFDFGLYFFHNAKELVRRNTGPYFYLPKLESHLEARVWKNVFEFSERAVGVVPHSIRATVLIETLPAAFEMDEILFELRDYSAGLNCGRWDYIFSFIKSFQNHPDFVMPDRTEVGMTQPFLRAYSRLLIRTCHRRHIHAMGGMAAQIPNKSDPEKNDRALERVRADKLREAEDGHDGTWVAHPGLVALAREIFDAQLSGPHQIHRACADVRVTANDLITMPTGPKTEASLRHSIRVGIQYLESWLRGIGCVALYDLMEDAATAEICRTQVWQWIHYKATLDSGVAATSDGFVAAVHEELAQLRAEVGSEKFAPGTLQVAAQLFTKLCLSESLPEFLTIPAYEVLLANETRAA